MKLIAKSDFYNSKALGLSIAANAPGFQHADHVHKGHRFSIGSGEDFEQLSSSDKQTIGALLAANRVMFDNKENEAKIKTLDAQVAKEQDAEKKAAAARAAASETTVASVLASIPDLIAAAVASATGKKA